MANKTSRFDTWVKKQNKPDLQEEFKQFFCSLDPEKPDLSDKELDEAYKDFVKITFHNLYESLLTHEEYLSLVKEQNRLKTEIQAIGIEWNNKERSDRIKADMLGEDMPKKPIKASRHGTELYEELLKELEPVTAQLQYHAYNASVMEAFLKNHEMPDETDYLMDENFLKVDKNNQLTFNFL